MVGGDQRPSVYRHGLNARVITIVNRMPRHLFYSSEKNYLGATFDQDNTAFGGYDILCLF